MEKSLDVAKEKALDYVKKGVINTYAVITKQKFYCEGDIERSDYDITSVVYNLEKDQDGKIIFNFMKQNETN